MRAASTLPHYLLYTVEHSKFEAAVIFYGCAFALILQLSSLMSAAPAHSSFTAITLPYAEAIPHGPALETIALHAGSSSPQLSSAGPSAPLEGVIWPLHGRVTTEFGQSDYPFQTHHTGIDITSARPAGASAIRVFKAGTVIAVDHGYSGYGNHVVIDHGGGLTSLYGHLYSTAVSVGQHVQAGDILGTEGSTGASTGPHLHFEIRQDGRAENPRLFVPGSP